MLDYYMKLAFANIFLIFCLVFIHNKKHKQDKYYFRSIPFDLPVGLISYYHYSRIHSKTIWLTLLDLIGKGYYSIKKEGKDYTLKWEKGDLSNIGRFKLYSFEKTLITFINGVLKNKNGQVKMRDFEQELKLNLNLKKMTTIFYEQFRNEIKNTFGFVNNENSYVYVILMSFIYFYIMTSNIVFSIIFSFFILGISMVMRNLEKTKSGVIGAILLIYIILIIVIPIASISFIYNSNWNLIFVICNPLVLINSVNLINLNFYNEKQKELSKNIIGLKNFLNDFSKMEERKLQHINLFDRYYAVSVALGVSFDKIYTEAKFDDESFETLDVIDFTAILAQILKY